MIGSIAKFGALPKFEAPIASRRHGTDCAYCHQCGAAFGGTSGAAHGQPWEVDYADEDSDRWTGRHLPFLILSLFFLSFPHFTIDSRHIHLFKRVLLRRLLVWPQLFRYTGGKSGSTPEWPASGRCGHAPEFERFLRSHFPPVAACPSAFWCNQSRRAGTSSGGNRIK